MLIMVSKCLCGANGFNNKSVSRVPPSNYMIQTKISLLHSVVWCGVVWCGVVWCGVVWCGVVWCGVGVDVGVGVGVGVCVCVCV